MESMTEAHRRCDLLLAAAEQALESGDWPAFRVRIVEFRGALLEHFAIEEEEVFPQFELRTGLLEPTAQFCVQHRRMREIVDALAAASPAHDPAGCRTELATLGLLYRQHEEAEERIIHPGVGYPLGAASAPLASIKPPLDLRGLEPPQPIVRIFEALERAPAEPLRVVLPHEPRPLYDLLREKGFEWSGSPRADGGFDLTIRKGVLRSD
jgi:hypothetical protein